jgi:heme/copper-type cytochrome/quinol oxidase subunit 2
MIEAIINVIVGGAAFIFLSVMVWFIWESNKYISERNKLRKETGKYYEHDIHEELLRRMSEKTIKDKE